MLPWTPQSPRRPPPNRGNSVTAGALQGPDALTLHMRSEVEQALRSVLLLDRYPKATVDVHCMVLERGGSEGAALLMAASLAAIDAGIHCRCVLSAASLVRPRRAALPHLCAASHHAPTLPAALPQNSPRRLMSEPRLEVGRHRPQHTDLSYSATPASSLPPTWGTKLPSFPCTRLPHNTMTTSRAPKQLTPITVTRLRPR